LTHLLLTFTTANSSYQVLAKSPVQAFARAKVTEYMTLMLGGNQELCKALIPDFPLGTRRMTPGHGYLQALTKSNVEVRRSGIKRFVPEGIELESGEVLKVDAIVCATGFNTSFCPRFPIIGRDGNLQNRWKKETPKAYMSCAVAGLPNYFRAPPSPTFPPQTEHRPLTFFLKCSSAPTAP
jgi:cation diffusion facilitator CzcD-associated flavoprotein CzcO